MSIRSASNNILGERLLSNFLSVLIYYLVSIEGRKDIRKLESSGPNNKNTYLRTY